MSGQATGWVLRNGPKDRAMRLVLLAIADAANADGEHSHPGTEGMMRGSLYGRAHVLATVRELVRTGWVVVEEQGGGRGKATVYGIPGVAAGGAWAPPERVQSLDLAAKPNGPTEEPKRSNPAGETVQSGPASPCSATVKINEGPTSAPAAREGDPGELLLAEEARACAQFAFEQTPKPVSPFPAVLARCREALRAGHTPDDLCAVIHSGDVTWTRGALEYRLGQQKRGPTVRRGPPSAAEMAADARRRRQA